MSSQHSAAGPAAGYHFQIQRALLVLLRRPETTAALSIETLDDITLTDDERRSVVELEQLKHSISAGSLSDMSREWWQALQVWMDLRAEGKLGGSEILTLVCTDEAPDNSAAALLRDDRPTRDPPAATVLLSEAANKSAAAATVKARATFLALNDAARLALVQQVRVIDGAPGVGEFRAELKAVLRLGLPLSGERLFLDQVVGMWERHAVDLLLERRVSISQAELLADVARIRDGFTPTTLPDADDIPAPDQTLLESYHASVFVAQLGLIKLRSPRVRDAIADYHRAFVQRARWLEEGLLPPGQLSAWERRLVDEWRFAFEVMLDRIAAGADDAAIENAGRQLHDALQSSSTHKLRGSLDYFVARGTRHGLADVREIGWHAQFQERMEALLGPVADGGRVEDAFRARDHGSEGP